MKRQTITFVFAHAITKHILKKGDSYPATFGIVFKELLKGFNPKRLLSYLANKITTLKQATLKVFVQLDLFNALS
ncbi:MAG: hypothetical protein RIT27_98 [Pseudomonadota bacterium]|jgi:hypothetical protein